MRTTLILGITAGLALSIGGTAVPAAAANSGREVDHRHCVSKGEFRAAKNGMLKSRVHEIFDSYGQRTYFSSGGGLRYMSREYNPCQGDRYSYISVDYNNYSSRKPGMRLDYKSMYISS